jgi:pimeloyl-ACP methyl ester carboxylesterase
MERGIHTVGFEAQEAVVQIPLDGLTLEGALGLPVEAGGLIVFVHGSGSNRHSPRNNFVARSLREKGLGTLLFDLLTEWEDRDYRARFDIPLLNERLVAVTRWLREEPDTGALRLGYFGASTGAAAALKAAAELGSEIGAVVSRGGRPDLAESALGRVRSPTLLIVGERDEVVLELNRRAYEELPGEKELAIVAGAGHLFEEPGALDQVARLASRWFCRHLNPTGEPRL